MSIENTLRGYEGVRQRMAELQSRLESMKSPRGNIGGFDTLVNQAESLVTDRPSGSVRRMAGQIAAQGVAAFDPVATGLVPNLQSTPPSAEGSIQDLIRKAALDHGLDPDLLNALVKQESSYNPNAVSSAGAMGLTQLMPRTAKSLGVTDAFDPVQNLNGGAKYLAQMLREFNGDTRLALAAYNAGPGAVRRAGGIPPFAETRNYVEKVMAGYQKR